MQHLFTVEGMSCAHCEKTVTQALQALDPQARVDIDRSQQRVTVDSTLDRAILAQALQDQGYTPH